MQRCEVKKYFSANLVKLFFEFFLKKGTVLAALRRVEKFKTGTKKNYQLGSFQNYYFYRLSSSSIRFSRFSMICRRYFVRSILRSFIDMYVL